MNKRRIYTILCYILLAIIIVLSIYGIISISMTMANMGFRGNYLAGIIIFVIVIILVIGFLIKIIKEELYRKKFNKKK